MLSFFSLDVLDKIWDLIESVSEDFPTYSYQAPWAFAGNVGDTGLDFWLAISLGLVVIVLFYVHGKQLRSCRDGQLS